MLRLFMGLVVGHHYRNKDSLVFACLSALTGLLDILWMSVKQKPKRSVD